MAGQTDGATWCDTKWQHSLTRYRTFTARRCTKHHMTPLRSTIVQDTTAWERSTKQHNVVSALPHPNLGHAPYFGLVVFDVDGERKELGNNSTFSCGGYHFQQVRLPKWLRPSVGWCEPAKSSSSHRAVIELFFLSWHTLMVKWCP